MAKFKKILFLFVFLSSALFAQTGGKVFQFLDVTNSARIASLGGKMVTADDNDLNLTYFNPAILSPEMHQNMVLNYVNYFAGINYGYAAYAKNFESKGIFAVGIHYLNYGTFQGADENGYLTEKFKASEYALNIIHSRKIDSLIRFGINIKPIFSYLETYTSFAMALDAGLFYNNPSRLLTASLVLRNVGLQLKSYSGNGGESLPFEIAIGISKRLQHSPFRFYLLIDHLEKPDLTYTKDIDNSNTLDPLTGESEEKGKFDNAFDKVMRHIIVGTEFYLSNNFVLRFGYNYRRRQEMKIDTKTSTVGFSWGIGIKINRFHLSYARSAYHLVGSPNYFSIMVNLEEFKKKL